MKSRTSCCSTAIFRSMLRRFWPVWTAYLVIWLVKLCGGLSSALGLGNIELYYDSVKEAATCYQVLCSAADTGPWMSFIFSALSAMCVYSFMYNARSAGAMAALPIRRAGLFLTCTAAGLAPLLAANAVVFLVALGVEASYGAAAVLPLLQWLAIVSMQLVLFFGLASLCAQLTGHIVVLPAVYLVLSFTAVVLEHCVRSAIRIFVYGAAGAMGTETLSALSPFYTMLFKMGVNIPTREVDGEVVAEYASAGFENWGLMLCYLAAGIVFLALALVLFRRRRMETAGDVVAVSWLKPVFKYCFALGGSFVLGVTLYDMITDKPYPAGDVLLLLLFMLLGGLVCWFAAEMLIKKTFRVFSGRAWLGFVVFAAVFTAFICSAELDLFGYEKNVPDAGEVELVTLHAGGSSASLETEENISAAVGLHRGFYENKAENEAALRAYDADSDVLAVTISYKLSSGKTLSRMYYLAAPLSDIEGLEELMNTQEGIESRNTLTVEVTETSVSYAVAESFDEEYNYTSIELTAEEAVELYTECMLPDIEEGTLGRVWLINDDEYYESVYECYVYLEVSYSRSLATGFYEYGSLSVTPTTDSVRTVKWLEEHGVELTLVSRPAEAEDSSSDWIVS